MVTVNRWSRAMNWSLHFWAYGVIVILTWDLPLPRYITVVACVAIIQSSAWWRGKNAGMEDR